jgi:cell division septum initiation protein DivIVA
LSPPCILADAHYESGRHNATIRTVRRWVVLPIADLAWRFHRCDVLNALAHSKGAKCLIRSTCRHFDQARGSRRNAETSKAKRILSHRRQPRRRMTSSAAASISQRGSNASASQRAIKYFRQRLRSRLRLCRRAFRRTNRKLDPLSPGDHHRSGTAYECKNGRWGMATEPRP